MNIKTLVLIRHAKSSWSNIELDDFDRPLNKRGKRDAPFMGEQLHSRNLVPDVFVSSSAKRAKKTAKIVANAIKFSKKDILFDERIYYADEYELFSILKSSDEKISTLFIVGHNYTLTDFANSLSNYNYVNIPTSGMVGMQFKGKWEDIKYGDGKKLFFDFPKLHQNR